MVCKGWSLNTCQEGAAKSQCGGKNLLQQLIIMHSSVLLTFPVIPFDISFDTSTTCSSRRKTSSPLGVWPYITVLRPIVKHFLKYNRKEDFKCYLRNVYLHAVNFSILERKSSHNVSLAKHLVTHCVENHAVNVCIGHDTAGITGALSENSQLSMCGSSMRIARCKSQWKVWFGGRMEILQRQRTIFIFVFC